MTEADTIPPASKGADPSPRNTPAQQDDSGYTLEFIVLMASLMSLGALAVDSLLPAFHPMSEALNLRDTADLQLTVSILFLGVALGQFVVGPLSDCWGRKPLIQWGLLSFVIGSGMCALATDFTTMLVGRFLQGLGSASPKVLALAIVRDRFQGRRMARLMSFIATIFILMPALAPAIGQGIMWVAGWRAIFWASLLFGAVCMLWFALRQPETLPPERRARLSLRNMAGEFMEVARSSLCMGYTVVMGLVMAPFIFYLGVTKLLFESAFGITDAFPLYFGSIALALGLASVVNGQLVMRLGMRRLSTTGLAGIACIGAAGIALTAGLGMEISLTLFMTFMMATFFCIGLLFGNLNALAMEPMGHVAGMAATVVGSGSTLIGVVLAAVMGPFYDDTGLPLMAAFMVCGALGFLLIRQVNRLHGETEAE